MSDRKTLPPIKSCPFCGAVGSIAGFEKELGYKSLAVACENKDCGAQLRFRIEDERQAIERWNKRAAYEPRKGELGDDDPFPYGEHKQKPMRRVPAKYFFWMEAQAWAHKWPAVLAYIERNRSVLEKEMADA